MSAPDAISHATQAEPDSPLYWLIADAIPHMVWSARPDGAVDFVNARLREYAGGARGLLGWDWKAIVHPDDLANLLATWQRSLRTGEPYEIECRLRRADGSYRWYHASARPLRDASGAIQRWFGTCNDIEEQVRSARMLEAMVTERTHALQASEARFRQLTQLSTDYYWETDAAHRFTGVTLGPRITPVLPPAEVIGLTRWELPYRSPDEAEWRAYRDRLDAHEPFTDFVMSVAAQDGDERFFSISGEPVFDEAGAFRGYRGVGTEVTARMLAERALRDSERRFQAFMNNSPAVAWIKDSRLRYAYVSWPWQKTLGRSAEEALGKDDFEFWPEPLARELRARDEEVLRTGASVQTLERIPLGDGRRSEWLTVKFPLPDSTGAMGVAGVAIDISERVDAESKAQAYAAQVRILLNRRVSAQEAERRRVADELHDLIGQNLTALALDLAMVRREVSAESATRVGERFETMHRLIERTVDAIRGVMGELRPPALEEHGLEPALRLHASEFSRHAGIAVSVGGSACGERLAAETELALFRIAQEALTNAAKHSGAARVAIELARLPEGLRMTVQDDGRGFAEAEGARSRAHGGWGIPAMRERAAALGGSFRVEFPGRGTRVLVEIPSRDAD